MKSRSSFLAPVIFFTVGMAFNVGQKAFSKPKIEIVSGIEYIHNSDKPLYPDRKMAFIEDLSIHAEGSDGNIVFVDPWLSFVDNNENIYILERRDQIIRVFNSNGRQINTIGAKGSGPGEFQEILPSMAMTNDGQLLIQDATSRRLSFFDISGRILKSVQRKTRPGKFLLIKEKSFFSTYLENSRDAYGLITSSRVKEIDFNGTEKEIEGDFAVGRFVPIRMEGMMVYYNEPVIRASEFVGDQAKNRFYHCINDRYLIDVFDISGKIFRKIDRPYKPVPFTEEDAIAYRARVSAPNEEMRKAILEREMPKEKSIVENMLVDDQSNLWIQTNEIRKDGDEVLTAFDIFDSEGKYIAKIWTALIPQIFKKGKMYLMESDAETGYKTSKRYRMIWE